MRRAAGLLCGLLLVAAAAASEPPRWQLREQAGVASSADARFRLKGRLARTEAAVSLHEGERFALLGRVAKANVGCQGPPLLRDGFEG